MNATAHFRNLTSLMLCCMLLLGCSSSGGDSPGPNQNPVASLRLGISNEVLSVVGLESSDPDGTIESYHWDFGDGNSALGGVVEHTYEDAGDYQVTLTVTDNRGATAQDAKSVTAISSNPDFSVSGVITAAINTAVDGDINNPLAAFTSNDDINNPQSVPSPLQLNGYVTKSPTNVQGDAFRDRSDIFDYYSANLLSGQYVELRVADFEPDAPSLVDVDLALCDQGGTLIAQSLSITEFEAVQVPSNGTYIIGVESVSGSSKYVLSTGNSSFATDARTTDLSADIVPGEVVVRFRENKTLSSAKIIGLSQAVSTVGDGPILMKIDSLSNGVQQLSDKAVSVQSVTNTQKIIKQTLRMVKTLNQRSDVVYAEPNYRRYPTATPNDSFYGQQWHYPIINLPQAWNITTGTPATGDVIVAVVDTGVVLGHEDFVGKLVQGYDFISDPVTAKDGDGIDSNPDDPGDKFNLSFASWHGTHVAGTIAARTDNNIGLAGVSWGAKIMPIRVLGLQGGSSYDIMQGVRYAAGLSNDSGALPAKRADIINLSLGGAGASQLEQDTYDEVRAAGVIVVAAAGNDSTNVLSFPAAYDGVISVSATDLLNQRATYSNFGLTIDVSAPGGNNSIDADGNGFKDGVLSSAIDSSDNVTRDSAYEYYEGTSMAAPHVAGVLALMKAVYAGLTPGDVDSLLINGDITMDLGSPGRDDDFGYGLIDALRSVQSAQSLAGGTPTGALAVYPPRVDFGRTRTSIDLTVTRLGSSPPTITGASADGAFIVVDDSAADISGAGEYTLNVDRSALDDGVYSETVTFSASNGNDLTLPLSLEVGTAIETSGDTGFMFLLAVDPRNGNTLSGLELSPSSGVYSYSFDSLTGGRYLLVGGSDVDNDGFICGVGESCAGYPTVNELQVLNLDDNLEGINFNSSIVTGVGINSLASDGADGSNMVFKRLVTP